MKVTIIGASGKTGMNLVRESLTRGYRVLAVCRTSSAGRLKEFAGNEGCTVITASVVSDPDALARALTDCDAVIAVLISVRDLKATELVKSLTKATATSGVRRLVFTAGEVTAVPEKDESFTLRQRLILALSRVITLFTPYSLADMIRSSVLVRQQSDWNWTIVRAPTLNDKPGTGYKLCAIDEVTAKHALSREDYAICMLDSLENPGHYKRAITVVPAGDG